MPQNIFNQKVEKTIDELFLELREHLKILKDDIIVPSFYSDVSGVDHIMFYQGHQFIERP